MSDGGVAEEKSAETTARLAGQGQVLTLSDLVTAAAASMQAARLAAGGGSVEG